MKSSRRNYRLSVRNNTVSIEVYPKSSLTVAVLSDIHAPFHDPHAIELALRIIQDANPRVIILNGDFVDFLGVSRFPVSPRRRISFHEEIRQARELLKYLRDRLPQGAEIIYLAGNHEERLLTYLWNKAKELAEIDMLRISRLLGCDLLGIRYIEASCEPKSIEDFVAPQVIISGKLYVTHGHSIRTSGNVVNVARTVFHKVLVPMLIGHWHRTQHHEETNYAGHTSGCWVSGCLCYPRPNYDAGRIWGQGLAIVDVKGEWFRPTLVSFFHRDGKLYAIFQGTLYSVDMSKDYGVPKGNIL